MIISAVKILNNSIKIHLSWQVLVEASILEVDYIVESVFNLNDGIRTANHYKFRTKISKYLMDSDINEHGNDTKSDVTGVAAGVITGVVNYELYGSWPQIIKESDLTYVEASIKTISVTLCYDYYIMSSEEFPVNDYDDNQ